MPQFPSSLVPWAQQVFDVEVGEGVFFGVGGFGVGVGIGACGEAEFAEPVVGFGGGLIRGGFGGGARAVGDICREQAIQECFAADGGCEMAAGVEGDLAVVGNHDEFAALFAFFDELGDHGIGGYARAGIYEVDIGEFVLGGFERFGAAVEDEGGFDFRRGGGKVAAEEADVEIGEIAAHGSAGVEEVVGVDQIVHTRHCRAGRGWGLIGLIELIRLIGTSRPRRAHATLIDSARS